MAAPTFDNLTGLLGRVPDFTQGTAVLEVVAAMARSYTRGQGFTAGEPDDAIRAVILTAAARLLTDTSQIVASEQMGPFVTQYAGDHSVQWSSAELAVLNGYRVRAM